MKDLLLFLFITLPAVYFVILFDPDGTQLGLTVWESAPLFVINLAAIIGNVFWIVGLLLFVAGGFLIYVCSDETLMWKTITADKVKRVALLKKRTGRRVIATITAVIAIGSGFWVSGFQGQDGW